MKKLLFITLAALITFVSCQKEDEQIRGNASGEVAVNINVDLPDQSSLLKSTDKGGVDASNWVAGHDLRYLIEIYDNSDNFIKRLDTLIVSYGAATTKKNVSARLLAGKTYKIVAWADFVAAGTTTDLHYKTSDPVNGLKNITFNKPATNNNYKVNDETRDAYFISESVTVEASKNISLTLKRPFAKVRVITQDMKDVLELSKHITDPVKSIRLTYENNIYNKFNALDGTVDKVGAYKPANITATLTNPDNNDKATLFWDYLFVENPEKVNFKFTVTNLNVTCEFNTNNIPIERNKLTTVRGNLLTTYLPTTWV